MLKQVGRYEVLRELGRGGMATVHLARQPELDRLVALKELHAFHDRRRRSPRRFLRESRLAGSLAHPNIVTVFDFLEDDGTPYIAMEYVEARLAAAVPRPAARRAVGVRARGCSPGSCTPTSTASSTATSSPRTSS